MNITKTEEPKQMLLSKIESESRDVQRIVSALDDVIINQIKINRTDLRILDALIDGPITPSMLVKATGITASAMTAALDRLESQNLVIRKRDLEDRRKIFIDLTDRCKRINSHFYNPIAEGHIELLSKMTESELNIIYEYLCMYRELYKKYRNRLKKEHYYIK